MSKTIDVEKGDVFRTLFRSNNMYQYRGERWRQVDRDEVGRWVDALAEPSEMVMPESAWRPVLDEWAYTITTPAAKDEAPAKTEPTPAVFHLKCPQCCFVCKPDSDWIRGLCGCKHRDALVRVDGPLVLPDRKPTPDVPVVDAVWVLKTVVDNAQSLWAFPNEKAARACYGQEIEDGTARIVRLAPDADLAATVKRVEERVNDLTKIVHGLQDSMPGYDKDVTADEAFRRLDERLSKLEATTIRLDRPMEFGQGPATAICLAALRAVGVHDEEVNRE